MNTRLSSLLVAGSLALAGGQSWIGLCAAVPDRVLPVAQGPVMTDLLPDPADRNAFALSIPTFSQDPAIQLLHAPERVVIDFPGVIKGDQINRKKTDLFKTDLISRVRIAQFASSPKPITRVVLEVGAGAHVKVFCQDGLFKIRAEPGQGKVVADLHRTDSLPPTLRVSEPNDHAGVAVAQAVEPAPPVSGEPAQMREVLPAAQPASTPLGAIPMIGSPYFPLPVLTMSGLSGIVTRSEMRASAVPASPEDPKPSGSRTLGEVGHKYTGTRLSIDVQSADLVTFLRILSEHGKFNLIVDPHVTGTYSFKFVETPWDQMLDVILKHAGLGKEFNNGVLRVAKNEKLQKEEEDRKKLDEIKALAGDLQSISRALSYAKVSEVTKILEKVITKRGSLIIDERTNTIIVTDLPKNILTIDDLIAQLDVQIQQVQIEARVVEASKGYEKAFGVKWPQSNSGSAQLNTYVPNPTTNDPNAVTWASAPWMSTSGPSWNGISNRPSAGQNTVALGVAPGRDQVTSLANPAGEFWVSFLSNRMSLNVILQALEKDGVVKIVSAPKVVTQNNRKATIMSGEKIPYPTIQAGAAGGAITVAFADANLQLDVTPQITNEGTIIMDIKVEKAEADFSRQVNGTPTILRKMVETQVLVKDGGTAVLGGVYTTNSNTGTTGVPFLSRLPILGWLFRSKTTNEKNSELLVFITPRIVKS